MEEKKAVKWDPLIVKLAQYNLDKEISQVNNKHNNTLRIKENWVAATEKRRSPEEFQSYIHEIFEKGGLITKYQHPSEWYFPPKKKKKYV